MQDMGDLYLKDVNIEQLKKEGLFFDMHFHTNYSDGSARVKTVEKICNKKNIGVALTDHNIIKAVLKAQNYKFKFIPGIELRSYENIDILLFFYNVKECIEYHDKFVKPNLGKVIYSGLKLDASELLDASKKYNCISCLPHPFGLMHFTGVKKIDGEYNNKNKFKDGIGILKEINAIEIINGHLFKRGNLKAFDLAMEFDKAYTAGSDGHLRFDLGNVLTYSRSNSREEFLDSILKKKNFVYWNDKGALKRKLVSQTLALRKHIIHPVHYIRRFARYSKKKLAHE